MPVREIMTTRLITVTADTTVEEMYALFKNYPIHHLLVVEGEQLCGVVSDRDVLRNRSPFAGTRVASDKDHFTLTRKARKIMTSEPVTVDQNTQIRDAAKLFLYHGVSVLPVVDAAQDGILVGILSWKDVLRHIIG